MIVWVYIFRFSDLKGVLPLTQAKLVAIRSVWLGSYALSHAGDDSLGICVI